jgi:hypothetical protein
MPKGYEGPSTRNDEFPVWISSHERFKGLCEGDEPTLVGSEPRSTIRPQNKENLQRSKPSTKSELHIAVIEDRPFQ